MENHVAQAAHEAGAEVEKKTSNATTGYTTFVESTLTLTFWLCASLLIMQPARLYFTHDIAQFFNFESGADYEALFMPFVYAYTASLLLSLFLVRVVSHVHVLALALIFLFILGTVLVFSMPSFLSAVLFGIALGLIPAPAVCSVVEKLGVSPSARQQKNLVSLQPVRPVGMYILIPVIATLSISVKHPVALLLIVCLVCLSILFLLLKTRRFGFFTSAPTLKESLTGTLANGMSSLVIFMLVLVSLIDVFVLYYVPHVVQAYAPHDVKNTTALVLLIMLMVRIAMIVFAELTLIRIAPRRMLVLSALAIVISALMVSVARDEQTKLIVLFVLSSSLSVVFPSLIKSMAKFTPFSVLPTSIVCMALVGNLVTMLGTTYFFPYALHTQSIVFFCTLFAAAFLALALLFFAISRRKKLVVKNGT